MQLEEHLWQVWRNAGAVKYCETDGTYYYVGPGGPALDAAYESALAILQARINRGDEDYIYWRGLDQEGLTDALTQALDQLDHCCEWCESRAERQRLN